MLQNGGCGSIGYGIATAYAKEGANLVLTGRNTGKLEEAKEELERLYQIRVLPAGADLKAGADNEGVVNEVPTDDRSLWPDRCADQCGAGLCIRSASGRAYHREQFDLALYSGLYATFYYMKACYPYLAKNKGAVINFASALSLFGNFGQGLCGGERGIRGLSRVAATEWARTASM